MAEPRDEGAAAFEWRARELFDRAMRLPTAERAAFVAREAGGDAQLRERVQAMLQPEDLPTAVIAPRPTAPGSSPAGASDKVHSTQTAEMLQRLEQSPRLDTQRYAFEGEVDRGGMGAILKIHDRQLNRRLAMKVLLDRQPPRDDYEQQLAHQILGRFLEEAQVTSQLDHPGVVPVHELGLDQSGKVYFTMRLVKGRTAHAVFREAHDGVNDWTITRALEVILKVCDTMAYAHDKGVLHRDLKPDNVMVGRFGEVYVMDWGLAKVVGQEDRRDVRIRPQKVSAISQVDSARKRDADSDHGASVVSMDGQKLGTPSYMPPEQARSEAVDVRADVYAIGAMLYELLAGTAPYTVPGMYKEAYRILEDVVLGPPRRIEEIQKGVPPELVAIVEKAMARDREQRYADTLALAKDLRAFVAQRAVAAYRTGALIELKLWVRRNRPLAASLAAAVLILVAGIVGTSWLANENAVLAQQKTELAASETKAKQEAAKRAEENAALAAAETKAKEDAMAQKAQADAARAAESLAKDAATKLAEEKGRTVSNFNQLAGVVRLKDALAKQDELWPAWPDKVAALEAWLQKDCGGLLAMRPQIEATIAELEVKALPLTPAQVEADRRAAPELPVCERQQQLVASLRRAQAIRSGASKVELPELPAALRDADAQALNAFAWPRVAPEKRDGEKQERTTFGEEAVALVAARAAAAKTAGKPDEFPSLDTLAWAALANGQDAEARQRTAEALAKAPAQQRDDYVGYQRDIEVAVTEAAARLEAAEAKLSGLEAKVSMRRTWTFGADADGESARFLHDALVGVLAGVNSMAAKEKVGVEQRLAWAQQVQAASLAHAKAGATWAAARAAIAKADDVVASKLYAGISIPLPDDAVIGLVPIGMNPVTKLWEFYDLRSAWDGKQAIGDIAIPTHEANGSIKVAGDTGIVFVLLPGGTVTLGSQSDDKNAPFYDPQRGHDETLHQVTLSPFLLARHELTQGQWSRLWTWDAELREPSHYKAGSTIVGKRVTLANPVESVDWSMCEKLVTRNGMVLPTEAEWEYGCRGGTTTPWNVGFEHLQEVANLADATAKAAVPQWVAFESWRDGHIVHAPVGSFAANAFGLYDVHGNVWEWCRDWYGDYGGERAGDGQRSVRSSANRVYRGGSFGNPATLARSASRLNYAPPIRSDTLGLRPARLITF